jgi:hypothetical protein
MLVLVFGIDSLSCWFCPGSKIAASGSVAADDNAGMRGDSQFAGRLCS